MQNRNASKYYTVVRCEDVIKRWCNFSFNSLLFARPEQQNNNLPMKTSLLLLCSFLQAVSAKRPHLLYVLADDYGWANVGFHAVRVHICSAVLSSSSSSSFTTSLVSSVQQQNVLHTNLLPASSTPPPPPHKLAVSLSFHYKGCFRGQSTLETGILENQKLKRNQLTVTLKY